MLSFVWGVPVAVSLSGQAVQVSAGFSASCARLVDGRAACWGRGERGQVGNGRTYDERLTIIGALAPEFVLGVP
jgi:membrane-bound inhibitor of C-type lysozyme